MGLAAAVLFVEMAKGFGATQLGEVIGADAGAIAGALGAIAGNTYNIWYRFRGGKGLGITAGVLLAAWPPSLPILVVVIGVGAALTRSSGIAALLAIGAALMASVLWSTLEWENWWGVGSEMLPALALGMSLLLVPKHLTDARNHRQRAGV